MTILQEVRVRQNALTQLCKKYYVQKLELFGSAATERFDPDRSDLDFLVTFEDVSQARTFNCFFDFKDELHSLFNRRVDLIEESAIKNPYLLQSIKHSPKELIYAAQGEKLPA